MNDKELKDLVFFFDKRIEDYASLKMTKKEFYKYSKYKPDLYLKKSSLISKAEKLRSHILQDRDLEVIYICGKSGSGKTTAAKYFASKQNYDAFISGSGEDFLDGYDMEEAIVLDDFRASSMRFNELLKMLDNNTNSSVRSRYYNKDISNCKLLFVTSVYQPNELYKFMEEEGMEEPIEQLYRRLNHCFYKIEESGYIVRYNLTTDDISATEYTLGTINDIYAELGIDINKKHNTSCLDAFVKKVSKEDTMGEVF